MLIFWNNTIRFVRFFFSAILGLFLTISYPILTLFKQSKYATIIIVLMFVFLILLINILKLMLGIEL
uniref:Uncharacterized protein ycf33 n=1 Tax=Corynoplastis japonica TaxID=700918 RepID=A0A1Y9TMG4_9RHOD|nr:conserved hypothetical plastid protein [Corynoplastis japonica]